MNPLHAKYNLRPSEVKELVKKGIKVKTGPFNAAEDEILQRVCNDFIESYGLSISAVEIMKKKKSELKNDLIRKLSPYFPERTIRSIRDRINLLSHPCYGNNKWTEEDKLRLSALVEQHGNNWNVIGEVMGRIGDNCKSVYRKMREKRVVDLDEIKRPKYRTFSDKEIQLLVTCVVDIVFPSGLGSISRDCITKLASSKTFISWPLVESVFNKRVDSDAKRHTSSLNEIWKVRIVPLLKMIKSQLGDGEWNLGDFCCCISSELASTSRLTLEDDLELIKTIIQVEPKLLCRRDLHFRHVLKANPLLQTKSKKRLSYRFKQLLEYFISDQDPLAVHKTRKSWDEGEDDIPPLFLAINSILEQLESESEKTKNFYKSYSTRFKGSSYLFDSDSDNDDA